MKSLYYHGSPVRFDDEVRQGTCVFREEHGTAHYAQRRPSEDGPFIYVIAVDPEIDLEWNGEDNVLKRALPFLERRILTAEYAASLMRAADEKGPKPLRDRGL